MIGATKTHNYPNIKQLSSRRPGILIILRATEGKLQCRYAAQNKRQERQLTLSSAIYSPPRPSRALFESFLPPFVRPQTSRPEAVVGLHKTIIIIIFRLALSELPPWTSHSSLSSSPSLKGPAKAPPTSCLCSSSRLIWGAWGSSGNRFGKREERRGGQRGQK